MEYEILSNIASVWILTWDLGPGGRGKGAGNSDRKEGSRRDEETLTMEFSHPVKNSSWELWNVNCAVTDYASYGYSWDVEHCRTRILDSSTTRCTCPRTGTFAVLMTKTPDNVSQKPLRRAARQFVTLISDFLHENRGDFALYNLITSSSFAFETKFVYLRS